MGEGRERRKREALTAVKSIIATSQYTTSKPSVEPLLSNSESPKSPNPSSPPSPLSTESPSTTAAAVAEIPLTLDEQQMSNLVSLDMCVRLIQLNRDALRRCLIITAATKKDDKDMCVIL